MEKWVLDDDFECIRQNGKPVLEASFGTDDNQKRVMKLASHSPEMLDMLEEVTEELCSCLKKLSEGGHDVDYQTVSESLELIKKATTI